MFIYVGEREFAASTLQEHPCIYWRTGMYPMLSETKLRGSSPHISIHLQRTQKWWTKAWTRSKVLWGRHFGVWDGCFVGRLWRVTEPMGTEVMSAGMVPGLGSRPPWWPECSWEWPRLWTLGSPFEIRGKSCPLGLHWDVSDPHHWEEWLPQDEYMSVLRPPLTCDQHHPASQKHPAIRCLYRTNSIKLPS